MKYYLRMEGVNLYSFIEDTQDLSTVRGGSLLLLHSVRWVEKWMREEFPQLNFQPISTGASNGLFSFELAREDEKEAERIRKQVSEFLIRFLRHATFVVDVHKADTNFYHDKEAVLARNRWRQWKQPTVAIPERNHSEQIRGCCADHIRPASSKIEIQGKRVSYSVGVRRRYGKEQKQKFYAGELERYCNQPDLGGTFVNDFESLTNDERKGNLHHKMAVIYLDGNSFGKIQHTHCRTEDDQRDFDAQLKRKRAEVLKTLLRRMDAAPDDYKTSDGRYRLETLLWGGDEVIWVVPAWKGWEVLSHFYNESLTWDFNGDRLTHAGGLVFCHHNAPIHRITGLCRSLAEEVKKEIKGAEKRKKEVSADQAQAEIERITLPGNSFQYVVLESFDHIGSQGISGFRNAQCPVPWKHSLDGEKMGDIGAKFRALKEEFPRNKIFAGVHAAIEYAGGTKDADGEESSFYESRFARRLNKILPHAVSAIDQDFHNYFGGHPGLWLHIAALWDYTPEERS